MTLDHSSSVGLCSLARVPVTCPGVLAIMEVSTNATNSIGMVTTQGLEGGINVSFVGFSQFEIEIDNQAAYNHLTLLILIA